MSTKITFIDQTDHLKDSISFERYSDGDVYIKVLLRGSNGSTYTLLLNHCQQAKLAEWLKDHLAGPPTLEWIEE